ncbi:MAG: hypothetical protein ABSA46_19435 [Thermodesulfovibrionales bacterium]|jgi:hypothetical protein
MGYYIYLVMLDAGHTIKRLLLVVDSDINSIRYSKVEISDSGIIERNGNSIVITIPREQIRQIKLCYDTMAKNPFCQYFLGFTLLSLGLIGLLVTFFAGVHGNSPAHAEPGTFVFPLVPAALWLMIGAGIWLLMGIFRARYHLWIYTETGIRKIVFDKTVDIGEIRQFIRKAQVNFGYEIDMSVLEKNHLPS